MDAIDSLIIVLFQSEAPEDPPAQLSETLNVENTKGCWRILKNLSRQANFRTLYPQFFPTLLKHTAQSYNPDLALSNLERFAEKILDKDHLYSLLSGDENLLQALLVLFSGSQILSDTLLYHPFHFDWLRQPETLNTSKSKDVLFRDYHEMAGIDVLTDKTPSLLRKFKKREYIRIGLRDLLGYAEMKETVVDLANLADVCLHVAIEYCETQLEKRFGTPFYKDADDKERKCEFAILGMGKLGGQELNFSSDIDLIYIYSSSRGETRATEPGQSVTQISNHEYYTKLGQAVTKTINEITAEGNVFRVDLDLRPEGKSGEIANSLASCEIYYESWGRTWERQALIKARTCAGSEALGLEFFQLIEPFIYRKSLDFEAIEEIKGMKEKINQHIKQKKEEHGNIKLGFGGIREVEFFVQAYQLLFGGRDPSLRERNTLKLLDRLKQCKFLDDSEYTGLKEAYVFLRNLENRVQISFGMQTHLMPKDRRDLAILARKMKMAGGSQDELIRNLQHEYKKHTQWVGNLFAQQFKNPDPREAEAASENLGPRALSESDFSPDLLQSPPFVDPDQAYRFLKSMRDGPEFSHPSEKSIKNFYEVLPLIIKHCETLPQPNSAVENLVRFVEASKARESFLSLFCENGRLLELLLRLFGGSDHLSQILVQQPTLMDVLLNRDSLYRYKSQARMAEELEIQLDRAESEEEFLIGLRKFKLGEELRIGIRYLLGESDLPGTLEDLSNLADTFLQAVTEKALDEAQTESGDGGLASKEFAIMGMGKLGGQELNFGSDLDVVFVYGESDSPMGEGIDLMSHYSSVSQKIVRWTSAMTAAGYAYQIDTDLRPEGGAGTLTHSLKGYERYFESRARIWERQALTRARFVAGNPDLGKQFLKIAHTFAFEQKLEHGSLIEISRLRERMEKELAQEDKKGKNVKLGYGGLADIEFTLQILQLKHGHQYPRLRQPNTLKGLEVVAQSGILSNQDVDMLRLSYLFLRNLECALRIIGKSPSSHLTDCETTLSALARLLDYNQNTNEPQGEALMADYKETTEKVHAFYRKTIGSLLRQATPGGSVDRRE